MSILKYPISNFQWSMPNWKILRLSQVQSLPFRVNCLTIFSYLCFLKHTPSKFCRYVALSFHHFFPHKPNYFSPCFSLKIVSSWYHVSFKIIALPMLISSMWHIYCRESYKDNFLIITGHIFSGHNYLNIWILHLGPWLGYAQTGYRLELLNP